MAGISEKRVEVIVRTSASYSIRKLLRWYHTKRKNRLVWKSPFCDLLVFIFGRLGVRCPKIGQKSILGRSIWLKKIALTKMNLRDFGTRSILCFGMDYSGFPTRHCSSESIFGANEIVRKSKLIFVRFRCQRKSNLWIGTWVVLVLLLGSL